MWDAFNTPFYEMQNDDILQHARETFRALVDAIIPRSPELAKEYGEIQYFGALNLLVEEYLILTLCEYDSSVLIATVNLLDAAAAIVMRESNKPHLSLDNEGSFFSLSPNDRILALHRLKQNEKELINLPVSFQNSFFYITDTLIRLTMMGYYSEWFGYGATRLKDANQRKLEFYPLSWNQVGYPGPNPSYHLINGFIKRVENE